MKHEFYGFCIDDEAKVIEIEKEQKGFVLFRRLSQLAMCVLGVISLNNFIKTNDYSRLLGAVLGFIYLLVFIFDLRKSYETMIPFEAIEKVKYKYSSFQNILILKLKNKKKRFIYHSLSNEKIQILESVFKENNIFEKK